VPDFRIACMTPRPRRLKLLRLLPDTWITTAGPTGVPAMYLSFDDGPHPEFTLPLLELLARYGARATFFLVGNQVELYPEVVRSIVAGGHTLGNHSHSHPRFEQLSLTEQVGEIDRTDRLLQPFDGHARHPFRPPRGVLSIRMLAHFIRAGRPISYWSYDSLDYSREPASELLVRIDQHPPRAGDILLMHDDSDISRQMLEVLLPRWQSHGLRMEALPPGR
jgi:peptidoglycan-N-acetylglucosamine deacetylase